MNIEVTPELEAAMQLLETHVPIVPDEVQVLVRAALRARKLERMEPVQESPAQVDENKDPWDHLKKQIAQELQHYRDTGEFTLGKFPSRIPRTFKSYNCPDIARRMSTAQEPPSHPIVYYRDVEICHVISRYLNEYAVQFEKMHNPFHFHDGETLFSIHVNDNDEEWIVTVGDDVTFWRRKTLSTFKCLKAPVEIADVISTLRFICTPN